MNSRPDAQLLAAVRPAAWTALPLGSGMTARAGTYTPQCRQWLDMVQLRGQVNGTIPTASVTIGTLPAGFRPAATVGVAAACSSGYVLLAVATTGVITAFPTVAGTWVSLDGLWFPLV